jgi:hypothetical protein
MIRGAPGMNTSTSYSADRRRIRTISSGGMLFGSCQGMTWCGCSVS